MSDELRAAADRIVAYRYRDWPNLSPEETKVALVDCAVDAGKVAQAWLAEHPADDGEAVTQPWLAEAFGPRFASCDWKRYALHIAEKFGVTIGWCPPCGNLGPCLCVNAHVLVDNPTRGHVRRLCAALGIPLKS